MDFSFTLPAAATPTETDIPISQLPTSRRSGESILSLDTQPSDTTGLIVSNGRRPFYVGQTSITVGNKYSGRWILVPPASGNDDHTLPNEWRFDLDLSGNAASTRVQFDLYSGDRDPVMILKNSAGQIIQWDDDGGVGHNARIVRELAPDTYELLIGTRWTGQGGYYQLLVTEAPDAELSDPDGESAGGFTETADPRPTYDLNPTIDISYTTRASGLETPSQGDLVTIEVTAAPGETFVEGDSVAALLMLDRHSDGQPMAHGAVGLRYVDANTLRGTWVAQWVSSYVGSNGRTTFKIGIAGHGDVDVAEVEVDDEPADWIDESETKQEQRDDVISVLTQIGYDAAAILDTLYTVYGPAAGYDSEVDFAIDFGLGAALGEPGYASDPDRGIAYFIGWAVLGFIPGVDIVTDSRDFLHLEILSCSGLFGCASAIFWDVIDLAAIIPGAGKLADVPQVERTFSRAYKSAGVGEVAESLKFLPEIVKNTVAGSTGFRSLWGDIDPKWRGRFMQGGLARQLQKQFPDLICLDDFLRINNFRAIDFLDPVEKVFVSVKSLDSGRASYNTAAKFERALEDLLDDAPGAGFQIWAEGRKKLAGKGVHVPGGVLTGEPHNYRGELHVILPEGFPIDSDYGQALKRVICTSRTTSGLPKMTAYFTGPPVPGVDADEFGKWQGDLFDNPAAAGCS